MTLNASLFLYDKRLRRFRALGSQLPSTPGEQPFGLKDFPRHGDVTKFQFVKQSKDAKNRILYYVAAGKKKKNRPHKLLIVLNG